MRISTWILLHTAIGQEDQPAMVRLAQAAAVPAPPARQAPAKAPVQFAKYDVCLAEVKVGASDYMRPVLVLRNSGGVAIVAPISTKWSFYDPRIRGDFALKAGSPGFSGTSLEADSFILGEVMEIPAGSIRRRIGSLTGELLSAYLDHSGHG